MGVAVDMAVVGNGRDVETLLSNDGRMVSEPADREADLARTVAFDTEDRRDRPIEAVAASA